MPTKTIRAAILIGTATLLAAGKIAAADSAEAFPLHIPAPGGEVIILDAQSKQFHDADHFATARRIGDLLYISGVIVGVRPGEGHDVAAFKIQTKRVMERLKRTLEAAGTDFQHVVMINSFHIWESQYFDGGRSEQFAAFTDILGEFVKSPYPAWTAVGTTGLLAPTGVVEVQLIASVPRSPA